MYSERKDRSLATPNPVEVASPNAEAAADCSRLTVRIRPGGCQPIIVFNSGERPRCRVLYRCSRGKIASVARTRQIDRGGGWTCKRGKRKPPRPEARHKGRSGRRPTSRCWSGAVSSRSPRKAPGAGPPKGKSPCRRRNDPHPTGRHRRAALRSALFEASNSPRGLGGTRGVLN